MISALLYPFGAICFDHHRSFSELISTSFSSKQRWLFFLGNGFRQMGKGKQQFFHRCLLRTIPLLDCQAPCVINQVQYAILLHNKSRNSRQIRGDRSFRDAPATRLHQFHRRLCVFQCIRKRLLLLGRAFACLQCRLKA